MDKKVTVSTNFTPRKSHTDMIRECAYFITENGEETDPVKAWLLAEERIHHQVYVFSKNNLKL